MQQNIELQPYPRQVWVNPHFQQTYGAPPACIPLGYPNNPAGPSVPLYNPRPTPLPAPAPLGYPNNPAGPSALPNYPPPTSLPFSVQHGVASISPIPYPPQQIGYPGFQQSGPILGALENLASLNQIFVKQKTRNKYRVLDPHGRQILYAKGDTDCCTGCCSSFYMKVLNGHQEEVMHFVCPMAPDSVCFSFWPQSIQVEGPPGIAIGTVEEILSIFNPEYYVKDASGKTVYYIEGPCWTYSCFGSDVEFKIYSDANKSQQVGKISKKWSGLYQELFTDEDNFGIQFPPGADPKMKAVLIAASILIDFKHFTENDSDSDSESYNN